MRLLLTIWRHVYLVFDLCQFWSFELDEIILDLLPLHIIIQKRTLQRHHLLRNHVVALAIFTAILIDVIAILRIGVYLYALRLISLTTL